MEKHSTTEMAQKSSGKHVRSVLSVLKPYLYKQRFHCCAHEKSPRPEFGYLPAIPSRNVTCALTLTREATGLHSLVFMIGGADLKQVLLTRSK